MKSFPFFLITPEFLSCLILSCRWWLCCLRFCSLILVVWSWLKTLLPPPLSPRVPRKAYCGSICFTVTQAPQSSFFSLDPFPVAWLSLFSMRLPLIYIIFSYFHFTKTSSAFVISIRLITSNFCPSCSLLLGRHLADGLHFLFSNDALVLGGPGGPDAVSPHAYTELSVPFHSFYFSYD